jgi:hypothetical protein
MEVIDYSSSYRSQNITNNLNVIAEVEDIKEELSPLYGREEEKQDTTNLNTVQAMRWLKNSPEVLERIILLLVL